MADDVNSFFESDDEFADDIPIDDDSAVDMSSASSSNEDPPLDPCWRCQKPFAADDEMCPYCRAQRVGRAKPANRVRQSGRQKSVARVRRSSSNTSPIYLGSLLSRTLVAYGLLLVSSIVVGVVIYISVRAGRVLNLNDRLTLMCCASAAVVIIVTIFLATTDIPKTQQQSPATGLTWFLAFPALAIVLVINRGSSLWIQDLFAIGKIPNPLANASDVQQILFCVLLTVIPAIIEELFFRRAIFNVFLEFMGCQATVWLTAFLFAMAHIDQPFGMPVLFLLGVLLGYARLGTGSIILPIVLHFLHNAVVVYLVFYT
jgi:uncharacterized protein